MNEPTNEQPTAAFTDADAIDEPDYEPPVRKVTGEEIIRDNVKYQIVVEHGGDLDLKGVASNGLIVSAGGNAVIHGLVNNLLVEEDGKAYIAPSGITRGMTNNHGGTLFVEGTIEGSFLGRKDEGTHVHPDATVPAADEEDDEEFA